MIFKVTVHLNSSFSEVYILCSDHKVHFRNCIVIIARDKFTNESFYNLQYSSVFHIGQIGLTKLHAVQTHYFYSTCWEVIVKENWKKSFFIKNKNKKHALKRLIKPWFKNVCVFISAVLCRWNAMHGWNVIMWGKPN